MKKSFKSLIPLLFILSIILQLPLLAQDAPPVYVVTDKVKMMEFNDQVNLVGRTEGWVNSKIVSEVSGKVEKINVVEGTWVQAGSPLVTISSNRLKLNLDAKRAETEQAQLQADLADDQLKRAHELFSRQLVAQTTIDSAVTWANITTLRYRKLDAERKRLELDYQDCIIRAPFSGYTGKRLVDVGGWVNPGMPVFEMVDLSHIRVNVDLPERYFGHLMIGSSVIVNLSGNGGKNLTGKVIGITPNASKETHTFPIIVDVDNSDGRLGGGMLVKTTLSLNEKYQALAVSKDAIIRQGNQTIIYTVVEGKAKPIPIITTSTNGDMIAVVSDDLQAGMVVVIRGNERIFPGSAVRAADISTLNDSDGSDQTTNN